MGRQGCRLAKVEDSCRRSSELARHITTRGRRRHGSRQHAAREGEGSIDRFEPNCGSVSIRPAWEEESIRESVVLITPMHMNDNLVMVVRMSPSGPADRSSSALIRSFVERASHRMPKDGPATDGQVRESSIEMLMQMRGVQARRASAVTNNLQVVPGNARGFPSAQGAEQVYD